MDINFFIKTFLNSNKYFSEFNLVKSSFIREEYLGIFLYVCFATFLAVLIVGLSYIAE